MWGPSAAWCQYQFTIFLSNTRGAAVAPSCGRLLPGHLVSLEQYFLYSAHISSLYSTYYKTMAQAGLNNRSSNIFSSFFSVSFHDIARKVGQFRWTLLKRDLGTTLNLLFIPFMQTSTNTYQKLKNPLF